MGDILSSTMMGKRALIIGAGPAGITAAYELLKKTDVTPVIIESSMEIGGISRTVEFDGNRFDIGGHRYFSKSKEVLDWWLNMLPLDAEGDDVMLVRKRISRILKHGRLFDYPLCISFGLLKNFGPVNSLRFLSDYLWIKLKPISPEENLEDFFINRFGRSLYLEFFKDYSKKVWGYECKELKPEWGQQRIKNLSVFSILKDLLNPLRSGNSPGTLIREFMYPKLGCGQMWERAAERIVKKGGNIILGAELVGLKVADGNVTEITYEKDGVRTSGRFDYVISSMPVRDLVKSMDPKPPADVLEMAEGLEYRDFIISGLLLKDFKLEKEKQGRTKESWIYVQEDSVRMGRLQVFNNWSPALVADPKMYLIGVEYFCSEGDDIWTLPDEGMLELALAELVKLGLTSDTGYTGGMVVRQRAVYPSYRGAYEKLKTITSHLDGIENLFLIGRNGMHRYNNMDHSRLTAMAAVENIRIGKKTKENIWRINTEDDYHEGGDIGGS